MVTCDLVCYSLSTLLAQRFRDEAVYHMALAVEGRNKLVRVDSSAMSFQSVKLAVFETVVEDNIEKTKMIPGKISAPVFN